MRHLAGFSHLGTLDGTLALHLGALYAVKSPTKSIKMQKTWRLIDHKKDAYLLYESWHKKAEHLVVGPHLEHVRGHTLCVALHVPMNDWEGAMNVGFAVTNKFLQEREFGDYRHNEDRLCFDARTKSGAVSCSKTSEKGAVFQSKDCWVSVKQWINAIAEQYSL